MPYLQEVWDDECLCHPHWSRITVIWYLSTSDTNNIGWLHNSKVISNMDVMKNAKLEPSLSTNISLILFISIIDVNMLGWLYSDMVYLQYGCYEEHRVKVKPCQKHYTDMVSPHCGWEYAGMTLWGGWGCEVSWGVHQRLRGKTTTGLALDGAVFDIAQILAYLVHNMSRSQLYLGFGHFVWLPSFFGQ